MSILVAVRKAGKTALAADSLTVTGSHRDPLENLRTRKWRRLGKTLLGHEGWAIYENILDDYLPTGRAPKLDSKKAVFAFFQKFWRALHERYSFVRDQDETPDSPFGDLDSSFILANASGIFVVFSDLSVYQYERYFAIGSGAEYAFGALHALYDGSDDALTLANRAVEAAIAFDTACGAPVDALLA